MLELSRLGLLHRFDELPTAPPLGHYGLAPAREQRPEDHQHAGHDARTRGRGALAALPTTL